MSVFNFIVIAIAITDATAINITSYKNQQETFDVKHKLDVFRAMVSRMNESMNAIRNDEGREIYELTSTMKKRLHEISSMNTTIQKQEQKMQHHQELLQDIRSSLNSSSTIEEQQLELKLASETMKSLKNKMTFISGDIQGQQRENQAQQDGIKDIHSFLKDLANMYTSMNISHILLETKVNKNDVSLQYALQQLVSKFNALRSTTEQHTNHSNSSIASIRKRIQYVSLSVNDVQKSLSGMKGTIIQQKSLGPTLPDSMAVAFSVSSLQKLEYFHNKKVKYDKILTNIGNAYNSSTGIFTCPSSGRYVFIWSTMTETMRQSCFEYIYRNGKNMLLVDSGDTYKVGSNSIVLSLIAGDLLWIGTSPGYDCMGYPYTSFTGFKLR